MTLRLRATITAALLCCCGAAGAQQTNPLVATVG
jgi:hypothetical protein